nr:MAG TPA: hypothetical protein [Caudoviricetes sp.]
MLESTRLERGRNESRIVIVEKHELVYATRFFRQAGSGIWFCDGRSGDERNS